MTLLKDSRTAKYHKRLQIVLFRLMGKSYKEIIELLDCNQTTIWRNVKKYEEFGLDSLLQETRGGRNHAYMTVEEEKAFRTLEDVMNQLQDVIQGLTLIKSLSSHSFLSLTDLLFFHCSVLQP
ncbi:Mobile element protein [Streptococcus pneumoniae]|nr:Mobile element protein [Streptococcus pneumoniae]